MSTASQAAKPFYVYVQTDDFAGGFRFDTQAEATRYVAEQALRYRSNRRHGRYSYWQAGLDHPDGRRRVWDAIDITDGAL
jgi:hypothetical protein